MPTPEPLLTSLVVALVPGTGVIYSVTYHHNAACYQPGLPCQKLL